MISHETGNYETSTGITGYYSNLQEIRGDQRKFKEDYVRLGEIHERLQIVLGN